VAGHVLCTREGSLARVELSHAGKLNAMSRAMWGELRAVFRQLHADASVRCVVLAGQSDAFCAGGDISEYPAFRFDEASLTRFHEDEVWGGLSAVLDCDVPVIAAIEGPCMGAGMEISSCCDIRIAGAGSKFGAPIARLGFPMAPREAQLVARVAGENTAREMLLQAAVMDAQEMKARGFLSRVVEDGSAVSEAWQSASRIAGFAPQAARLNKQALRTFAQRTTTGEGAYSYAASAEHREGVAAYLEKRRPQF
jgi:enoyl-CoA hydratase/carnithine racemase